jgi:hypothetical protein
VVASIGATVGATGPRIVSVMVTAGATARATLGATAPRTVAVVVIVNAMRPGVAGQRWDVDHSSNAGGWWG